MTRCLMALACCLMLAACAVSLSGCVVGTVVGAAVTTMVCSSAAWAAAMSGSSRAGRAACRTDRIFIDSTRETNQMEHMYIC